MQILPSLLEDEMQLSYLDYAMSVIIGRAIPDANDGLKPAQRRILYAMYNINNTHDQPTKKSARIVGEVIGKFHPHGDTAVYEALVRMAQDFSMNHTFVEGQGNFGSIDGDPPAAMRYTEVRLTKLAEEMLADIDKDVVDFVPNFDNTEKEPVLLPAKLPNLLINGASGIAVGVATSIPPHNLGEVCDAVIYALEHPEYNSEDLLNIIKGPDFPTGGTVLMGEAAYAGYRHGRGRVTIKAKAEVKGEEIIITEIPYGVNKSALIEEMANLAREKKINGISDIRDESGKEGIRIRIKLKNANGEQVLNFLFKHTQLMVTFPIINLAVVGNTLKNFNISQFIAAFINHRRNVIRRRTEHDMAAAKERTHILEGLLIAIENIDNVIKIIKGSSEIANARQALISSYNITEKQANAILDMKLSRLTSLEHGSITSEKSELDKKIVYYSELLADQNKIDSVIKEETLELKKKYARARRTVIENTTDELEEIEDEDTIPNEKTIVIFTNTGYIKRMSPANYREQMRGGKGIVAINLKEGDYTKQILHCYTKETLLCITDKGNAYWLKAYMVPEGSRYSEGKAIVNMLNLKDERVIFISSISDFSNSKILFLTKKGIVKKVEAIRFSKPRSTGIKAISIDPNDSVAEISIYSQAKYILIATKMGKIIKFDEHSLRTTGRSARGVRGIKLREGDEAINVIPSGDDGNILSITQEGYGKLTQIGKYRLQHRGGKGIINFKINQKTGAVAKVMPAMGNESITLINSVGIAIMFDVESIRVTGRAASGVRLMRLPEGAKVVDAILMEREPENAAT